MTPLVSRSRRWTVKMYCHIFHAAWSFQRGVFAFAVRDAKGPGGFIDGDEVLVLENDFKFWHSGWGLWVVFSGWSGRCRLCSGREGPLPWFAPGGGFWAGRLGGGAAFGEGRCGRGRAIQASRRAGDRGGVDLVRGCGACGSVRVCGPKPLTGRLGVCGGAVGSTVGGPGARA